MDKNYFLDEKTKELLERFVKFMRDWYGIDIDRRKLINKAVNNSIYARVSAIDDIPDQKIVHFTDTGALMHFVPDPGLEEELKELLDDAFHKC